MLDGVKVPKEFEPVFKKAEEFVSKYFSERRENPSEGTIEIFGQRYIFVRAAAMSVEFFDIIKSLYGDKGEREAMAIARSLLYDIAHAIGIADAREFHRRMDLKDPIEKLSAGPLHFSHSGWAFVDIFPESRPTPDEEYYLIYDHPYSFESDAWIKAGRHAEFPVCVMNAGYSSGWCEESFGVPLVATEILCRAEGDDCCRFVMAHPSKIEKYIREYVKKKPELGRRIKNYEIPGFFSRKKAEEELRKNEEKFRNLAEEITDGVIVTVDHETRWINKAYCEIFGYEKQELLGKGPEFFLLPEEVPGIKRIVEDMLAGIEVPATYEALARRKDGEIIVIEFSGKAITYEGKKATQVVIRDVTKRKRDEEKLIMLRNLVDESNDALFVIDIEEGRFLDANMKACKNLGYSREELRGMNVRDVEVILPDQPSWEEHVKQLSEYGQLIIEGKHRRKGGTTFPVEASVSLISHQGRDFIVAVARDITERKRAEEAIRKSEERWRSLVENAPNIIIIQDREGTILFINRTVPGLSVEDTLGSKVYQYIPTEYHKLVRETTEKVFETGESGQYEIAGVGPHGRTSWYHTQLGPIMQDGEVVAVTLITTDVTEHKRGERELVRVMKAVEGASDAIAMADPAGDHIYQNKAFSELFEYQTTEELDKAGGPLTTFVDKDVARELFGTIKGGGSWSGEVEMLSRSGRVIPVEVRGDAVKDEGGNIIGLIGIHTEITERKLVEELRIRMESKIQHMQRLESLGALAGGIARDFNNLLMNVLGNANLALRDLPKDSNASQLVQEIEAAGRKAAELSRQMLAYSGKGRFVLEKINMSNLIRAMSQLIEASAGREIMMRYDLADELPEIVADSSQMRQVVMGLIANAAESYIEEVGFVTIKTGAMNCDRNYFTETYLDEGQKPGRYVFVEVSDTGRGMYEQTIEMMFDPFFTTKEKGRGLGLAAVLGIVRGHDGAIKVDTTPGKGTTIRVLFPAIEKSSDGESGKVAKEAAWSAEGTVLVAEEEESIRLLTERMLHTLGFKTISTGVGSEVLEIFRENAGEIRAVLLDMGVPGLNFEYVLAEMQGLRGDLAVVLTSGYDRTDTVTRLTGKGRIEFIQKPYTVEDLTQTLRSLLEKS